MSLWYCPTLVLICCTAAVLSTKLCARDNYWYDADTGRCRSCTQCDSKSMELAACAEFSDALCVDLSLMKVELHRWHEMETKDDITEVRTNPVKTIDPSGLIQTPEKMESFAQRSVGIIVIIVVLCIAIASLFIAILITVLKIPRHNDRNLENCKAPSRFRLFRDRLSTTDMKSLATLDRKLAMDEILEKRRRAIFEPQQYLVENIYSDDVFIDISSGIPRRFHEDENEPTQRLLETNQRV